MKRFLFIIVGLGAVFLLQLIVSPSMAFRGVEPPLFAAVLSLLFFILTLPERFISAAFAGLLFDSVSLFPFGTFIFLFLCLAAAATLLMFFFSHVESLFTRAVTLAILLFIFLNLILPTAYVISYFGQPHIYFHKAAVLGLIFPSFVWAVVLSVVVSGCIRLFSGRRGTSFSYVR